MNKVVVNLTNHPSSRWSDEQRQAALDLGTEIIDVQFPNIDPEWSDSEVADLAETYIDRCKMEAETAGSSQVPVVVVQGEMTFVVAFVTKAAQQGIPCIAATSKRLVEENDDGTKTVKFEFCQFRFYRVY